MIPIPPALIGPAMGAALVLFAAAGGWSWLRLVHDPAIRAEYAAELEAQVAAEREAGQRHAMRVLAEADAEHRRRLAEASTLRERIIRVPVTTACAASPAVAAVLDGLRPGPGAAGAARDPAAAARLPAPAPAARPAGR